MQRAIILFLVFFSFAINSKAEEPAFDQAQSASPVSESQQKYRLVTAIEVKGNKAISNNTIISKMKTRIGGPYQDTVVSDDLKRLYLLGFFSDVKINSEDYKNGVKVIIEVSERPLIEKITFSGIKRTAVSEERLKSQLKSKEGQYLDYPNLTEDVRTVKKTYEKLGFSNAQIDYKVELDKESNKAKVQFNITEETRVRIKDIIIKGNHGFSRGRILKLIKTKRAWLLNPGVLKEDVLKEDMERIRTFYHKGGFTDVVVDDEVEADPKKPYLLYITININEGKKYLVGSITIQGNKDIPQKDILTTLKECIPGKVFSQEALKIDVANIQGLYFDRGYISAQIQDTPSVNPYTGRVDIVYSIVENEISYVNKIKIKGNVKTRDVVIRRELRIRPADRFDGEKLRRSRERLQNLGFFEEVSYDTEDTNIANKKDLVVEVKESKTGSFSFGGGYSTVESFVGFIEVEQKNFDWKNFPYFTGAGQDLRFRASLGTVSHGFDLSFTNPWVFDYPVSFGFDAYNRNHQRDTDVGYGYDEEITGGDLRLGRELTEYVKADIMYQLYEINITNITDNASEDLRREYGKNTISSIVPTLTYDSRDNIFDTTKGNLATGTFELAGGPFGGTKDFWKFYSRLSHYFPLPWHSVLEVRGRVGLSEPYRDSDRVPIYDRFFAGGAYTVRGYDERKLGPIDPVSKDPLGGQSMLIGNIEYTYPLFDFLKVAAFYDVGNVWEKLGDIGSSKDVNDVSGTGGFKSSFGLGLRIRTPIGPIMLDYGIPLDKGPGEDKKSSGKFHFSASHGF